MKYALGICLVVTSRRNTYSQSEVPRGQPVNHPSVLLADDNKPLMERVAELLASSFDVVGTAANGRDLGLPSASPQA